MSWGSRSNNGPQWNMSWWKVCKMKRNRLKDQGLSWIFVKKLILKSTHAPLVENTWRCHILLQMHESFSEVPLVQIHYVMSYLSFYFSLFAVDPVQCFSRTERCWRYWQRSALFSSSGRACFLQGKEVSFPKRQTSQGFWTCRRNRERVPLSLPYNRVWTRSWEKNITVKPGKPWTREIFPECYCLAREKPISHEKTKPQARTLVSLWFCGQFTCPDLCCDWS